VVEKGIFFEKGFAPKRMRISTSSSTDRGDSKVAKDTYVAMRHGGAKQQQHYKEDDKLVGEDQSAKHVAKQVVISISSMSQF